jgi:dihydrofolate reductase
MTIHCSSLDSYIARKGGGIDWLFTDDDYGFSKFYDSVDTILVDRKNYDQSLTFDEYPYRGKMVYVFTHKVSASAGNGKDVKYVDTNIPDTSVDDAGRAKTNEKDQ